MSESKNRNTHAAGSSSSDTNSIRVVYERPLKGSTNSYDYNNTNNAPSNHHTNDPKSATSGQLVEMEPSIIGGGVTK